MLKCEIMLRFLLPKIRKILAKKLYELGYTEKEIATYLNVSQATVSYYIKDKRVNSNIKINPKILNPMIHDLLQSKNLSLIICKYCNEIIRTSMYHHISDGR